MIPARTMWWRRSSAISARSASTALPTSPQAATLRDLLAHRGRVTDYCRRARATSTVSPLDGGGQRPHPCLCQSVGRPLRQNRKVAGEESPGSMDKRCRITSGGREPRDSATENRPPRRLAEDAARVKRCGKSAPRQRQRRRHGKPHREQDRIGTARGFSRSSRQTSGSMSRSCRPGRLLEAPGNRRPRGMAVTYADNVRMPSRTRLIDRLTCN